MSNESTRVSSELESLDSLLNAVKYQIECENWHQATSTLNSLVGNSIWLVYTLGKLEEQEKNK